MSEGSEVRRPARASRYMASKVDQVILATKSDDLARLKDVRKELLSLIGRLEARVDRPRQDS